MQQAGATQPDPAAEPLYTSNDALVALTYDMAVVQTDIDTVRIAAPGVAGVVPGPVINIYDRLIRSRRVCPTGTGCGSIQPLCAEPI